ncbi:TPA_asm: hypothetical protein G0G78_27335, partial [Salmonella enterica]|nr:hypothetical protein [Salmonella enterica]
MSKGVLNTTPSTADAPKGDITVNAYNPNVAIATTNPVYNAGTQIQIGGGSVLTGGNIVLSGEQSGSNANRYPVFINGAAITGDGDITLRGVNAGGAVPERIELRGANNTLRSIGGNITIENQASGNNNGVYLNGTTSGKVQLTANGTITLNGSSAGNGAGVLVDNSILNASQAVITGSSSTGKGFSLTNTTLGGSLADLTNVTLSSAGSGSGVTNELDSGIVNDGSRDNLLAKKIENMTTMDMEGKAIFDDSAKDDKGWTHNYSSADNPNGGWIFNNTTVTAGGDVILGGVGFTNSKVNVSSGNLSIVNSGPVSLNGSDVSVSGDVVLSSVNDTVNINNADSKRASVISEHGNITVKANPGAAGSGYSVLLNGADLQSSAGYVDITGINTGSGNSGGVSLANTNIKADGNITINGSALSGLYSGVFLGDSVNLTASGHDAMIDITGHSTGPSRRPNGVPDAGVYLFGSESTLSAANINISGYNPNLQNSAGIIIGQTHLPANQHGASFTFNGNTSLYGDGGQYGIDLGIWLPNSLAFNNGNVSMTGIQRGPRDVAGSGGISAAQLIMVGGASGRLLPSIINITTANVSDFTIHGIANIDNSLVPGIGSAGLNGVAEVADNIHINFSGQVGRLNIKGEANGGSGVNTQVFNVDTLNATDGVSIQGESNSGTGVVLSAGDYSKNKVNIVGTSTSGNAVRLNNNLSLANATICGTSDTGSGVVFNGVMHNLTNVEVTGQTFASGNGILVSGLDGNNVSMHGTSYGSSGVGTNLAGPVLLSGNTQLNGTSPLGTGLRVGGTVEVAEGSTASLTGHSTTGNGVALRNAVDGVTVTGESALGAGVVLGDDAKITSTSISGMSEFGTGVSIAGKTSLDEQSAGLLSATSDNGTGLGLSNNTVLDVVQNGMTTPVEAPVVLTGASLMGSGVATSGNVSISGAILKGTAKTDSGTGVTLGGNLTIADAISGVTAGATGNGTALVMNDARVNASGYTDAGQQFVINASVSGNGTAIKTQGSNQTGDVVLNGAASGGGTAVELGGQVSGANITGTSD